jgi:hypothetical protein
MSNIIRAREIFNILVWISAKDRDPKLVAEFYELIEQIIPQVG